MFEVFMLVEKKKSIVMNVLYGLFLFLAVLFAFGMIFISPILMTFAVLFGALTWFVKSRYTEYEYSYFDGEIRFTKILNKSRRKKTARYNMDETLMIAPSGDRSVYNYENNSGLKVKNLTSGYPDAKVYVMVTKGEAGQELVKFEPDEEFLNAICAKYAQKVKK